MAFLLVFRLKTAYARYRKGRNLIQAALMEMREMTMHYLILVKGGEFGKTCAQGSWQSTGNAVTKFLC